MPFSFTGELERFKTNSGEAGETWEITQTMLKDSNESLLNFELQLLYTAGNETMIEAVVPDLAFNAFYMDALIATAHTSSFR